MAEAAANTNSGKAVARRTLIAPGIDAQLLRTMSVQLHRVLSIYSNEMKDLLT